MQFLTNSDIIISYKMESKQFEENLKEAVYDWEINPEDRSWIIFQDGIIMGGESHRSILENHFSNDWNKLKENGKSDSEIEMDLERKLIRSGSVYIGGYNDFYAIMMKLDDREKNMVRGFVKSIYKKNKDSLNKKLQINQLINGEIVKCMISDFFDDSLFSNK
jgi:hypothetical protein